LALPLEFYPAKPTRPSQRPSPLMGSHSLQHMMNSRSTHRGRKPTRYVPSSGFGYPLDGLLPRIPGRSYFVPAALLGFALRRFVPSSEVARSFDLAGTHVPLAQRLFRRLTRRTGPKSLGCWVHASRKCLAIVRGFSPTTAGSSLGLRPSRVLSESLGQDYARPPLTRFAEGGDCSPDPPASRSFDQLSPRLARDPSPKRRDGRGSPYGICAPVRS